MSEDPRDQRRDTMFANFTAAMDQLTGERDRLRAVIDGYVDDLSHIAFAVAGDRTGAVHHDDILGLVQAVVHERDQLALGLKAERDINLASGCPDCGVHDGCYRVVVERDRLRAVVDALRPVWTDIIAHVEDQIPQRRTAIYALSDALDWLDRGAGE